MAVRGKGGGGREGMGRTVDRPNTVGAGIQVGLEGEGRSVAASGTV
jgi:hypothetical protein